MSVLILDNKRILLNGISRYEVASDKFYYRNYTEEERFFFIWVINEDELWSKYSFKYLYIKMTDDNSYKFVSDKKLYNLMKDMAYYFDVNGIDFEDEILEDDEYLGQAVESYVNIKDNFIFVNEDISYIANRLDYAFGTI